MEKTEAAKYFKNLFHQCFASEESQNIHLLSAYYLLNKRKELTFPSSISGKYHNFLILLHESFKSEKSEAVTQSGRFENLGLQVAQYGIKEKVLFLFLLLLVALFFHFCTLCTYVPGLSSLGVPGVPWHTQILADQVTLFQPGGTDYAHLITTGTPGFSDLPTALCSYDGEDF